MESKYKIGWIVAILLLIIVLAYGSITGFAWSASPSASPSRGSGGNQPPTVSAVYPTVATQNQQTRFKVDVTDKWGVSLCNFNWDESLIGAMTLISGTSKSGTWARDYTPLIAGNHIANATCKNIKNAIGYGPNTNIKVNPPNDTQAPNVSAVTPTSGNLSVPVNYSVTASDNVGVTWCTFYWDSTPKGTMYLTGGTPQYGTWSITYTEINETGLHVAQGQCRDAAYNWGFGILTDVTIS